MEFRLNPALARYLRERPEAHETDAASAEMEHSIPAKWRVRDRLNEVEVAEIITAFKDGTAKHVLAERYGVSLTSIKNLLRKHGVKGKPGQWPRKA